MPESVQSFLQRLQLHRNRRAAALSLLLALPLFTACGDDDEADDHEDVPATMEITVAGQTVLVTETGAVTGGPITIAAGQTAPLTAVFRADDGDVLTFDSDYELRGASNASGIITFARNGQFTGTVTGVAAGTTTITFQLFHIPEGHDDFEQSVPFVVQ